MSDNGILAVLFAAFDCESLVRLAEGREGDEGYLQDYSSCRVTFSHEDSSIPSKHVEIKYLSRTVQSNDLISERLFFHDLHQYLLNNEPSLAPRIERLMSK